MSHSGQGAVRAILLAAVAILGGAGTQLANAQASAPLRIVVPFPPGGAADSFARLVGQRLVEQWQGAGGRQVVVENRTGAGGIIGTEVVAKAPADGNTLLMVTVGHAVNPYMYAKLPYDTRADLAPLAIVAKVPSLVVVGAQFPAKTLKGLLDAARAQPGKIEYGSSGVGSTSHVGAALIESMTGVEMLHVPYKGAAAALQDVIGGRITTSVDIITSSVQLVRSQKLNALAITGARRSALLPDVPTVAEAGVPGYEFTAWYMLLAPGKTPPAALERLNADVRKAQEATEFRQRIQDIGGEVVSTSVAEAGAFLEAEFGKWAKVVRDRNIKAD